MILVTKDGRKVKPIRMGCPDREEATDIVYGIEMDSPDRDLFGKRVVKQYSIGDFAWFIGSYAFPYFSLNE